MGFRSTHSDEAITNACRRGRGYDLAFSIPAGAGPVASVELLPGQGLVWNAGSILLAEDGLRITRSPARGREMVLISNAGRAAPARAYVGSRQHGPLGAFDLARHGRRLVFARAALAGVGSGVAINRYGRLSRLAASQEETGLTMLEAEGGGWLFLSAASGVIERRLMPGEAVTAGGDSLVAFSATVDIDEAGDVSLDGAQSFPFVHLKGPGTIWLQTAPSRHPADVSRARIRVEKPVGRPVLNVVR